jgi:hypothetical protein
MSARETSADAGRSINNPFHNHRSTTGDKSKQEPYKHLERSALRRSAKTSSPEKKSITQKHKFPKTKDNFALRLSALSTTTQNHHRRLQPPEKIVGSTNFNGREMI